MRKVGIITCHASYNYGAALQSYGLYKALKNMGFDVEHIDYRQKQLLDTYKIFQPCNSIKNIIRNIFSLFIYKTEKTRANKFESFTKEKLNLSKKCFNTIEELNQYNFEYDAFVCGSDQIWNSNLFIDDDAYYLSFVNKGKKVSYAPSMGDAKNISKKRLELLQNFDYISIREKENQEYLQTSLKREVPIVVDPVFLLEKKEWDDLAGERIIKEDYIYFYTVGDRSDSFKATEKIAEKLGLKVVVSQTCGFTAPYPKKWEKRFESGPIEFINYIKYAKFVVASSFHATAFSTIFNVPFFSYNGNKDNRMNNLLVKSGLMNRGITIDNFENKLNQVYDIKFDLANKYISTDKNNSIDFLKQI